MARFRCELASGGGVEVIEAADRAGAVRALAARGVVPRRVEEVRGKAGRVAWASVFRCLPVFRARGG